MNPPPIILKSDKLASLLEGRDKLKVRAAQSRAEILRLTKIVFPQHIDVTVIRIANTKDKVAEAARSPGITLIGADEQETALNDDILKRTLAGEPLSHTTGSKEKLDQEHRQLSAIENAIEFLDREIYKEKTALASQYCKTRLPDHDAKMKRLYAGLLETHSAWLDLYEMKRQLIDSGIGLRGICLNLPESFLSTPNNSYSEMAEFFRIGKLEGYISKIPAEYVRK
jgi:hypothetical protein